MTEEEYLRALVEGIQRMFGRAASELKAARSTVELQQAMDAQRAEGVAFLDSLDPPPELLALHARLRHQASQPRDALASEAGDASDMLELAKRAERYGLELIPGLTAARIEEIVTADGFGADGIAVEAPSEDWETRMRRILALNGHTDPEGVIEHLRGLREG